MPTTTINAVDQAALERAQPRCDRACPQRALVMVGKGSARLALCGHDFGAFEIDLGMDEWRVVADIRPQLAAREATR